MTILSGKVWGTSRLLFSANNVEIHRIAVAQYGICSKHRHRHKSNAFYVESGRLAIDVWKHDYPLVDRTVLEPGDYTVIAPGEFHRFQALEDAVAYEIYFVELDSADIERETVGMKASA